jgi:transposase-like protein
MEKSTYFPLKSSRTIFCQIEFYYSAGSPSMYKLLYDGLSQRSIAAALGKSSPTVQNLIRKTRLESQRIIPRNDLC